MTLKHVHVAVLGAAALVPAASAVAATQTAPALQISITRSGENLTTSTWDAINGNARSRTTSSKAFDGLREVSSLTGDTLADAAGTEWEYSGLTTNGGNWVTLEWHADVKVDPFVSAFFAIQNPLAVAQTFEIVTTLPVAPITGGTYVGGSSAGSVSDATQNGALLTSNGPLFQGLVDGNSALGLLHNLTVNVQTQGGSAAIGGAISGLSNGLATDPGPTQVLSSIGVRHRFTLSPGDVAAFTSYFQVDPVPEPGTLGLLGVVGLMSLRRSRAR